MNSHSPRGVGKGRFPWYAAMLYVGLVTALVVADGLARRSGIDPIRLVAAFLIAIPLCLAGARALEVVLNWSHFRARPREILRPSNGGAAMYGALPLLFLLSFPLSRWIGVPLGTFWDAALVSILAGMIPTRLGCLGAGCCAGRRTTSWLGLNLRNARGERTRRYPSQLFEAAIGAALLSSALVAWDRLAFPGAVALWICAGYGAGRLGLEALREERAKRFAGLGVLQWMSATLLVLGVGGLTAGSLGAHAARVFPAVASEAPGALHLLVSGLLLLPIVHLFRFVGCQLIFKLEPKPPVLQTLDLTVAVPDRGTGPVTVRMKFKAGTDMTEIEGSPFDIPPAGVDGDGRLLFADLRDVPEDSYSVECSVERANAVPRFAICDGVLMGANLRVGFQAQLNDPDSSLSIRFCFE